MRSSPIFAAVALLVAVAAPGAQVASEGVFAPGARRLLDAHNCYPEEGLEAERIDRALSTGTPLAIEQDLAWSCPAAGRCTSVVSHTATLRGDEPTLETYFFDRVRPIVERALASDTREGWPLITLNLDFKTLEPEHIAFVAALLERYDAWLTTAERRVREDDIAPLRVGPVLVLTGDPDVQQSIFHDRLSPGDRIRAFGAVHVAEAVEEKGTRTVDSPPRQARPGLRTNYRRWWNNPWVVVEGGGQNAAGPWTPGDADRLRTLVRQAHEAGLWIRFYTLNGTSAAESRARAWTASYNFGSLDAVRTRWAAAIDAGVDFVATDQYEAFARELREGTN
jgi:hypothetical protein